ncbi:phage tail tape measure protein [Glutamicibacter arilaitensis]|uniref:phage tail tape measure protein n=1 Tax=Glutamicibacter arilaitensis TaxID=256701 RepID=UPI0038502934
MAVKDLRVIVGAEIGSFLKDMDRVSAKAKETAKKTEEAGTKAESGIGRLTAVAKTHEKSWDQVSKTMVGAGLLITGGLALSGKAAMDWQSQFAGVRKTIDDTEEGYTELSDGLRDLAKELPSTHAEIAGVAEAAGQLGVARDDVLGFTDTMIDLSETTNLTAEDAATNIAQISNVMGTMEREGSKGVERFGSTLVALGNDGASTEAEILSMAQRIAGAGASLNASEADVLALSNTLASMGVRAELGGGVATRVLLKMRTAVDEGGESVQAFADVAGTSADEFAAKFRSSPMEALQLVAEGIARTNDAGGNLTATLKDMGIKGTEEMQVMLALANSGDLLTESLELGSKAWEENSALADEAAQRYATAESKVKVAWNNIKDAGIDAGASLLPVIASLADGVADLVGWFTDLPEPAQTALTVLASLVGVGALVAGAFMKIAPNIISTVTGLRDLRAAARRAEGPMTQLETRTRKVGGAARTAAAGLLALATVGPMIGSMVSSGDLANIDNLNALLLGTSSAGQDLESIFTGKGNFFNGLDVDGLGEAFRIIGDPSISDSVDQTISKILTLGSRGSSNMEFVTKNFEQLDSVLTGMVKSGNTEQAADTYEILAAKAEEAGVPVEKLAEIFPQYAAALRLADAESKNAAKGADGTATAYENAAKAAKEAADAVDDWYDSLVNAGMVQLNENEALRALEESFDKANETITKNGKTLDETTEKGRENGRALDAVVEATYRSMEAQRENGASTAELSETMRKGREQYIKNAEAAGMNADEAKRLADELNLIPGSVYVQFNSNTDSLARKLTEIHELVQSTPDGKVQITENSPEVRRALEALGYIITEMPDGRIEVSETGTDEAGNKIDETAAKKRIAKITAEAITGAAEEQLRNAARNRYSTINVKTLYTSEGASTVHRGGSGGLTNNSRGGHFSLPGYKDGGQLPRTGLGTDMILGVTSDGRPAANLDDEEWIIRATSANKYNRVLGAINADDPSVQHLASYAGGGQAGGYAANTGSAGSMISIGDIIVHGAGDPERAAQAVEDRITSKLAKVGMRIG